MGWFLLLLLFYFLILLAEQSVIVIAPHDLDTLRNDPASSARRALSLAQQPRPTMAALLLARLFLKVILIVFGTAAAWSASVGFCSTIFTGDSWWAVQCCFAVVLSSAFAALFWGLKKINLQQSNSSRSVFWLQRLSLFALFWKTIFMPFIREKKVQEPIEKVESASASAAATVKIASEKRDMEMLKSIVKFGDVTVKQVMQPRSKVVAVDFRTDFQELLATVREAGFSRLPVYDDDFDNVTGILYVKDLVPHLDKPADFEWQSLIRTNVPLAPESKRASELLQEFKQQKIHLAIVIDEYGGSAGIVTMEDILEEVTGEIRDEFDEESDIRYRKLDDSNYLFEGQILLNDVCRITGVAAGTFDAIRSNADTLAGLALELRGDIPKTGTEIPWNGFLLKIMAADNRRITQIKMTLP